ncbi:MAG: adenylosuccinate synthase [Oscillospiraceae bacterium]|jgi:adenylosuccinate synthase|nr:adenylosuccinate synthase [Oscillospiraceae bacterium]
MLTAVVGINWGDEGKGRMVDLLADKQDIVCRYQGGNNAGHTVINPQGKFILNLLPSGILRGNVVNVMGNGMAIDLKHLCGELDGLEAAGVKISPENLKISDRAVICMPYHVELDKLEESRLGDARYGSTNRGIAPVYGDKYMKKGLRIGDLLHPESLEKKLSAIVGWKNLTYEKAYGAGKIEVSEMLEWLEKYGGRIREFICDTGEYLSEAAGSGKNIMFEAQLGALRDIDFGIYPYTSSSSTIAAYSTIGAGIPGCVLDMTVGVIKAYSTCVGEGPFTAEIFGEEAERLREAGGEYGAATGRPRRVGPFDAVASRYGVRLQGADCLALTKLDILSGFEKIAVCTGYEVNGKKTESFPVGDDLINAKPVIEYVNGWSCDISRCRTLGELPAEAAEYIRLIERLVSCPVKYVSVGPEREAYIEMY